MLPTLQGRPQRPVNRADKVIAVVCAYIIICAVAGFFFNRPNPGPANTPEITTASGHLNRLKAASLAYARHYKRLPTTLNELVPRYIKAVPKDPYGRPYILRSGGPTTIYIWFQGQDGELKRYPPDMCAVVQLHEAA